MNLFLRLLFFPLLLTVFATLLVPSCFRPKPSPEEVILRFAVWGGMKEIKTWPVIAREFERRHKNVKVKVEFWPGDYYAKLLTMLAARDAPDCFYLTYEQIPAFASKGTLMPLDDFVKADRGLNFRDFFPQTLSMFRWRGNLYGLPKGVHTLAVFLNLDLFLGAGLEPPKEGWTWADYLRLAKALTKDLNGDGKPDQFGTSLYPFDVAIYQSGGAIAEERRGICLMDRREAIKGIKFCRDLIFKHKVAPPMRTKSGLSHSDLFVAGKLAMFVGGTWELADFKDIKAFEWTVAPLPKGKIEANLLFGAGVVVWALTRHPQQAYLFARFATSKEGDEISSKIGHSIPARRSALHVFLRQFSQARTFVEGISVARLLPREPWYREVDRIVWEEVEKVLSGRLSPEEACQRAARRANEAIERYLSAPQG